MILDGFAGAELCAAVRSEVITLDETGNLADPDAASDLQDAVDNLGDVLDETDNLAGGTVGRLFGFGPSSKI